MVTPPLQLVFEFIDRYPTHLELIAIYRTPIDRNSFQVGHSSRQRSQTAVTG